MSDEEQINIPLEDPEIALPPSTSQLDSERVVEPENIYGVA